MKVIIFGAKNFASLAKFYMQKDTTNTVCAFTVDNTHMDCETFEGLPVIPFADIKEYFDPKKYLMLVPVYDNALRAKKYFETKEIGYKFLTYVSSKSNVYSKNIGENCFIMDNNTLEPYSKIGNNVMLCNGNYVGNHSVVEDHVFVSSHVVIGDHAKIESFSWLDLNSTVGNNILIRNNTYLNIGGAVMKDTIKDSVYSGSPADITGVQNWPIPIRKESSYEN